MLKTKIHNKLVRDKIPAILASKGISFVTRQLTEEEYGQALVAKLKEEVGEFAKAFPSPDAAEEIIDMWEVLMAIEDFMKLRIEDTSGALEQKSRTNGAFCDRIFLVSTQEDVPATTLESIKSLFVHRRGKKRWFEIQLKFSDDWTHTFDFTLEQLHALGATEVTNMNCTKRLRDWIVGAGRAHIETEVNKEDKA